MRAARSDVRLLACSPLLLLALAGTAAIVGACGEDSTATGEDRDSAAPSVDASTADRRAPAVDAEVEPDSSTPTDAGVDATVEDASKDANDGAVVDAGPTTSLFFLGDFAVNNTSQLGDALLPSSSAAPVVITDGAHTAKQVLAFDAQAENRARIWGGSRRSLLGGGNFTPGTRSGSPPSTA